MNWILYALLGLTAIVDGYILFFIVAGIIRNFKQPKIHTIMRTEKEIQSAVQRLLLNKCRCYQYNFLGEDNHKALDVTIEVIRENRSKEWIYQKYPFSDEDSENYSLWCTAMSSRKYLDGEIELDDLLYPELHIPALQFAE